MTIEDATIEDVLPAVEELDEALLNNPDTPFSPSVVEDTAATIAANHAITQTELLEQFTLFVILSARDPDTNEQFYQQLKHYLTTHHKPTE